MEIVKLDAFIVVDGISSFDIKKTKDLAIASVEYDREHGFFKSRLIPCTIEYDKDFVDTVDKEKIKEAIKLLQAQL